MKSSNFISPEAKALMSDFFARSERKVSASPANSTIEEEPTNPPIVPSMFCPPAPPPAALAVMVLTRRPPEPVPRTERTTKSCGERPRILEAYLRERIS